jgi:hypothetical protein
MSFQGNSQQLEQVVPETKERSAVQGKPLEAGSAATGNRGSKIKYSRKYYVYLLYKIYVYVAKN